MIRLLPLLVAVLILSGCAEPPPDPNAGSFRPDLFGAHEARYFDPAPRVEADSGLVFEYGGLGIRYTFDSVHGTLIRHRRSSVGGTGCVDTASVALTPGEMRLLLGKLSNVGPLDYPHVFAGVIPVGTTMTAHLSHYGTYRLDARWHGQTWLIRWTTNVQWPLTQQAVELRRFGETLEFILRAHELDGALPPATGACM